jgi:DNA replication protein DnaC
MHRLKEALEKLAPSQEKIIQNDFSEIELDEQEIDEALRQAREDKFYRLEKAKYWDRVLTEAEPGRFTTEELRGKLKGSKNQLGKSFMVDNDNRAQVDLICQYFALDPKFEESGEYRLDKGLALMGNVGVGKTYLMAFFFQNQNASYVMANCRKIEGQWVEQASVKDKNGRGIIEQYSGPIQGSVNANPFGHTSLGVCFDDLGTETSPSKAYGEEKNVLAEILMNRYETRMPYNLTHVTTNLSAHDIGIKYGVRVRDRFREMFNVINFPNEAKSRR